MIKDIKGGAAAGQQTWTTLEQSTTNLSFLFSLLKNHLEMNKALPGVQTLSSQVFTGKVKKGMPGFAEFGTAVDVQISAIVNPLLEIIGMRGEAP